MAKLWDSELGYMMENYEEKWPMMVYMHKYLALTSRDGRRKKAKAERRAKMKMSTTDKAIKPKELAGAGLDAKHDSNRTVSLKRQLYGVICHGELKVAYFRKPITPRDRLRLIRSPLLDR